ncbi:MAG TPA: triphosphoribosyl-dephospho-CoA synthase [Pirellulales bacterium]|jgi:triphosphoribosyl-dephospho-CoA synthase|nr:triphosphoribosyl-dephospho-CoA synthase [Pirellulales bacterium]
MPPVGFTLGQLAGLACLWEACASKPGNVHRGADFEDLTFVDFAASAVAIGPSFDGAARGARLGQIVLDAVQATRDVVATNTNLGAVLLMAPLAMATAEGTLREGVARVLRSLDSSDARLVYEAIRLAHPGGLGKVEEADVAGEPPGDLLYAMSLAADRDLVARQYGNNFQEVFGVIVPAIEDGQQRGWPLGQTIVRAQLRLMSEFPDSLIGRKCGAAIAKKSALLAAEALNAGQPGDEAYERALADFDFWLRSDGHRRNPGTTADLVAAGLFAALRTGVITPPVKFY